MFGRYPVLNVPEGKMSTGHAKEMASKLMTFLPVHYLGHVLKQEPHATMLFCTHTVYIIYALCFSYELIMHAIIK